MSAFALRKRLLAQQSTPASPIPDRDIEINKVQAISSAPGASEIRATRSNKRAKRGHSAPSFPPAPFPENESSPGLDDSPSGGDPPGNIIISSVTVSLVRSLSPPVGDDEISLKLAKTLPAQLSSFKPSRNNHQRQKSGRIDLKLSDGERLVVLGSYGIRVVSGDITINGATLYKSESVNWVYAPLCHALPVIRCSKNVILELHPCPGIMGLKSLGLLSPQFKKLWNEPGPSPTSKATSPDPTFQILYTSEDGPKRTMLQDLVSPPEWNREIARLVDASSSEPISAMIKKPISVMVTGPKSSGKSTFGKILANRLMTDRSGGLETRDFRQVAVLDLDPGQPEYCVAGQVALVRLLEPVFSPSFCHPLSGFGFRILRSHALASNTPAPDPELYLEAAMDLMAHYRNRLGTCPLIINTPGWIQGTGLNLLTSLVTSLRPAEVVYMSESGPAEVIEALQESCKGTNFSALPSQTSQLTSRTAAHFRSMQTMSYFHADSAGRSQVRWNQRALTTVPPWQVNYSGPNRGIFGIMCYDYQAPLDLLADAINGTVLAVVGVESTKAFRQALEHSVLIDDAAADRMDVDTSDDTTQHSASASFSSLAEKIVTRTPEGIPFIETANGTTLDPRFSYSLGLVLVRGIDAEKGTLQLLTPMSTAKIDYVTELGGEIVLVSGKFDSPSWAYTEELYYQAHGETRDETSPEELVETNGDEADDDLDVEDDGIAEATGATQVPWVEVLHGNQKRGTGSKVWRVRRDLGK
ncbi:hypothetical protein GGR54DRAFT_406973 [Hypoxylon sp. NC1633]|nr:hypothetical protein GGR54DRAFT_406973 [Hypoxylon sp. NC1633]